MFESLSQRLDSVFERLRGKGRITEQDVTEAMREVRQALLEADVNFKLVKQFVARVQERAMATVGAEVLSGVTAAQQIFGIVHEELVTMVAADMQRPAAVQQLQQIGRQLDIPVYAEPAGNKPVDITQRSLKWAREQALTILILDT